MEGYIVHLEMVESQWHFNQSSMTICTLYGSFAMWKVVQPPSRSVHHKIVFVNFKIQVSKRFILTYVQEYIHVTKLFASQTSSSSKIVVPIKVF